MGDELQVFPTALQDIREKIIQTKQLNKQRKMELASVMTCLMDAQLKNRQVVEKKLNSHIDKVKGIFEEYEKRARE